VGIRCGREGGTAAIPMRRRPLSNDDGEMLYNSEIESSARPGRVCARVLQPRAVGLRYIIASERE
jgi:hypothetical protein